MNTSIKEEQGTKCLKHGKKIRQVVLDANCLPDDRLLCSKCIELSRQPFNRVIGVAQAKEMIKEKILSQNAQIKEKSQPYLTKLASLQQKLFTFRESLTKKIDNMIEFIQKWISEINNNMNTNLQIELQKVIELLQQDHKELIIQFEQNGKAYLTKLYSSFKKLLKMEGIKECKQELLNFSLNNDQIKLKEQLNQQVVNKNKGIINCIQINQVKQEQMCNSIAFNKSGNIMIAGFHGNIKVWLFDNGNINEFTELKGQAEYIYCLIYCKRSECFVSGDINGNLQLWKQDKNNKEWLASNIEQEQNCIFCIILNQQEDQLISCQNDIIVWQVNYEKNQLSYSYTLENKHTSEIHLNRKIKNILKSWNVNTQALKLNQIKRIMNQMVQVTLIQNCYGTRFLKFTISLRNNEKLIINLRFNLFKHFSELEPKILSFLQKQIHKVINLQLKQLQIIYSLNLNDSETALVSCSQDKQIILWVRGADDKWMYQNNVKMDYSLYGICFINENEFIGQQKGRGYSNVFRIKDKQLKEQKDLKIKLTDKDGDDDCFFPTIYNKQNDVIIQKSNNYVYIIRRDTNSQFKVQAQPIDCGTYFISGSMTEDGHHLVIWNGLTQEFRIYKLNYE